MNVFPAMRSPYPGANPKEIDALEARIGCVLPNEFKEFYLKCNGGRLVDKNVIEVPNKIKTVINCLFSVGDIGEINVASEYVDYVSMGRIPLKSLPFANDPAGNLFLVNLETDNFGSIYFWNHEEEDSDVGTKLSNFQNIYFISLNLISFFSLTKEE